MSIEGYKRSIQPEEGSPQELFEVVEGNLDQNDSERLRSINTLVSFTSNQLSSLEQALELISENEAATSDALIEFEKDTREFESQFRIDLEHMIENYQFTLKPEQKTEIGNITARFDSLFKLLQSHVNYSPS